MTRQTMDFPDKKQLHSGMNVCFKIYVPSTRDKSIKISSSAFKSRVKEVSEWLSQKFEGATIDYVYGDYKFQGKIISERVALISVFTSQETYNYHDIELNNYLKKKKYAWGQDSMGFEYKDKMIFI